MNSETRRKLLAICCVGISVCMIVVAAMLGKKHVDFEEYAIFEYTGINGYAGVSCRIDKEKLYNDLSENEANADKLKLYREFVDSVKIMTAQMDLSNGDRVYGKVSYNEDCAMQAGIQVGTTDVEVRAGGLSEGTEVDLFKDIEVIFAGISPEATVVINNKSENAYLGQLTYTADKTEGIVVGDKVTITCNVSGAQLGRNGFITEKFTQMYAADALSTYAESVEQVSEEAKKLMEAEIEAGIRNLVHDTTFRITYKATKDTKYLRMTNEESVDNIQFEEAKFLKRKTAQLEGTDNYVVYLYSADVSIAEETVKVYFAFEYSTGYITHDGEFKIMMGNLSERYSCSSDYDTIVSGTLVGGKPGYSTYDVTKCTIE